MDRGLGRAEALPQFMEALRAEEGVGFAQRPEAVSFRRTGQRAEELVERGSGRAEALPQFVEALRAEELVGFAQHP